MLKTLQWTLQIVFLVFSTIIVVKSQSTVNKLRGVYSWKALEFAFPNNQARENAILIGDFIPGNPVPIDVDVDYGGNYGPVIFVAIPRFQKGVPMTLGYVTDALSEENNPVIAPYPDWSWNTLENCEGIISVYRVQIDDCRRIWILDTGVMGEHRKCPPQILSFSLDTNKLLSRYRFPKGQYKEDSLFVTPAIDVRPLNGKCRDTFVYIADVTSFALIVYDHRQQRSWKIYNKLFYPYPMHGTFHIKNETFDLMDGILGLALGPLTSDGDRILYFHSLASRIESRVSTSVIRNFSLFHENAEAVPRAFKPFKMERSSQSAAEAMDRNGVLFYGLMSDLAIGCWNSRDYPEFGGLNMETVAVDDDTLQFPSGVKVVTNESGRQELWVLTSSFQRYMSGSLHPNETNFRIQAAYIDELVRGTKCDCTFHNNNNNNFYPPQQHHHHYHHSTKISTRPSILNKNFEPINFPS